MPAFPIAVTQVFRVERTIKIQVEADDIESAVEAVTSGAMEIPEYDNETWEESFELMNEESRPSA